MKCRHVRTCLQSLLDGVLEQNHAARIEQHVGGCSTCRREFEALLALDAALSAEPTITPPQEMSGAIVNRALARARMTSRVLVPRWLEGLTFAGLALTLAAVSLTVVAMGGTSPTLHSLTPSAWAALTVTVCAGLGAFGCLYYGLQT